MYLIFTDESGTNKDSKVVLYGGLAIEEYNLTKSELIISDIAKDFFGIENMLEIEIHFVDIFNYIFFDRMPSKKRKAKKFEEEIIPLIDKISLSKEKLSKFVIELLQFLSKVNATFLVSVLFRDIKINTEGYVFKIFLNIVDAFLNKEKEYGLLIADGFYNQISKKDEKINIFIEDVDIKKLNQKELLFKRILFESVNWKQKVDIKDNFPLKYKFESKVYNIFGNILFIPSNESHLIQISDILLYVIKKFTEFKIKKNEKLELFFNKEFIDTFKYAFYRENIIIATMSDDNDTLYTDINNLIKR
jgi:hypothetical protein